jgi:hypothetical protein
VFFGWVLHDTRLSMVEIVGDRWFRQSSAAKGGPQFTRAGAGDSFFPTPVSFGFCLGFSFVFSFTVCLCNAQLLLDNLLA